MRSPIFTFVLSLFCMVGLLTTLVWHIMDNNFLESNHQQLKIRSQPHSFASCKNCGENIKKALEVYSEPWTRQDYNYEKLRLDLKANVNGFDTAIISQMNTPVGSQLVYDGERKRTFVVDPKVFNLFTKGHPFSNKRWDTCSVVGNGGILGNSSCGKMIDSAEFVIRCNLPPLSDGYEKHVGTKTDLVTANPTILINKFESLVGRRRPLMEKLSNYGNSMLVLPAFSFGMNTAVCMRTFYAIQDFQDAIQPVIINPEYIYKLFLFWRSRGLKEARLSTGVIMASLALELCDNVHLYGFWPFSVHPYNFRNLTQHYYDDMKPNGNFHSMPSEFNMLLQLHKQGVLRLHLGECEPDQYQ
ncbi:PREDICTED: alpha-2,8-sialyltransferase 8F-like [Cyprinodon variegatus]|uniref:ST8 alpha-N-acetyl-neuraminide alpha-2,8-sialyltransferase 6 n=1 Tax=Cyprinodon variegatus TaxID=28743 RepID=A0A3Q2CX77_CYPVA|nr:PREDICTED: alpha-2,8-sialyltransferase 8F-like [Cyprinodon variegatus]